MRVQPHLTFRGDCEEAFRFYERLFGGKLVLVRKTFWSPTFGVVVDRFGSPWEITVE